MKRSQFSEEQIIGLLQRNESGVRLAGFAARLESAKVLFISGRASLAG